MGPSKSADLRPRGARLTSAQSLSLSRNSSSRSTVVECQTCRSSGSMEGAGVAVLGTLTLSRCPSPEPELDKLWVFEQHQTCRSSGSMEGAAVAVLGTLTLPPTPNPGPELEELWRCEQRQTCRLSGSMEGAAVMVLGTLTLPSPQATLPDPPRADVLRAWLSMAATSEPCL